MLTHVESGVAQGLWPQEWVDAVSQTNDPDQQMCTLLCLIGRDYRDTIVKSSWEWSVLFSQWATVEQARENERAYSGVPVDPVT